ncbi:tetratricopeptide repeat protein [Mesorhizobium sp. CN5-321]|jgi:TPR repeat protein|uniref:tetratricopeptide repeat protein n=1 Tax=Mesorhizobium hunchu TaxID=3157708 RepID=UPI0032B84082
MRLASIAVIVSAALCMAGPTWAQEAAKPKAAGQTAAGKITTDGTAGGKPSPDKAQPKGAQPESVQPEARQPDGKSVEAPVLVPPPALPAPEAPDLSRFGDRPLVSKPISNPLPQPATTDEPPPLSSADTIDPSRFGGRQPDAAYGAYQRGLYKTAYNLALVRAKNGDPAAETLVAEILSRGLGVPLNAAEAAKWYQRAAEQGVPEAQLQYALILLDGRYATKDEKAAHALMQAAAEAGNPLAQFNFAQLLVSEDPGDAGLARAIPYYERAAATGLPDAQYAMAQVYANGVGGRKQDDARARGLLFQAARQNFDTAQLDLGDWLIQGRGGKRDYKAGFGWTKVAAEGGNVAAQNHLAKLYMMGLGVEPDTTLAAAWYIVARRAGLIDDEMEDFMNGLTDAQTKEALKKANRLP